MDLRSRQEMYNMVCEAPTGDGFRIDHMPEFFDYDAMDNSLPHVHTFYEIIWFQEAGGVHTVDFQNYEVEANSIFFLSPGQVHHFDGTTRHKGVLIKFCTNFLEDEKEDEDVFIKYNVFNAFDSTPYCVIQDSAIAELLGQVVHQMEGEQTFYRSFGHLDMLRSLVKIFLINVHRFGTRKGTLPLEAIKPSHRLFVLFRKTLEQHFEKLHTVKEYADKLNVSTKTLSNSVVECSGKAPLGFINDRILLEAKRLLRYTNLMVKEVAYRLGYDDPSYFVKFFKRQTGLLPSDFRELNIINQQITMKQIAVPTRDGLVDNHFGHCDHYTIFHINENRKIIKIARLESPQGCGCKSDIAEKMQEMGVTLMLAGNMGQGAYNKLSSCGIEVIRGCKGNVEEVVKSYLDGTLVDSCESCSHHDCADESPVFMLPK